MTRPPAPRVPGFPAPPRPPAQPTTALNAIDPHAGVRQLNVRVLMPLLAKLRRLIRELDDAGFRTNLTEVVQAILHRTPDDPTDLRAAVRDWRHALDPDG